MWNYNLFALTARQIYECKLIINDQPETLVRLQLARLSEAEKFFFNLLFMPQHRQLARTRSQTCRYSTNAIVFLCKFIALEKKLWNEKIENTVDASINIANKFSSSSYLVLCKHKIFEKTFAVAKTWNLS